MYLLVRMKALPSLLSTKFPRVFPDPFCVVEAINQWELSYSDGGKAGENNN